METDSLMRGNYIFDVTNQIVKVERITESKITGCYPNENTPRTADSEHFKPIPFTEEIALLLGFGCSPGCCNIEIARDPTFRDINMVSGKIYFSIHQPAPLSAWVIFIKFDRFSKNYIFNFLHQLQNFLWINLNYRLEIPQTIPK